MSDIISDQWYESFFQGLNCELWEKAVTPDWTRQEVDFLMDELGLIAGQQLLDIPCGFGRHAIEFAKRGIRVTGVDISKTYIAALLEKIKTEALSIEAIQGDILSVQLNQKFSGAICMGNSFGYFDFEKMGHFVRKVASSLEQGGKFIIHSGMMAESILPNFSKQRTFQVDNITMEITNTYHVEESCMSSHIHYTKEGSTEDHAFKHYVFTLGEVRRLLKSFGLSVMATYNSPDRSGYNLGDHQIYIVAGKD